MQTRRVIQRVRAEIVTGIGRIGKRGNDTRKFVERRASGFERFVQPMFAARAIPIFQRGNQPRAHERRFAAARRTRHKYRPRVRGCARRHARYEFGGERFASKEFVGVAFLERR